MASASERFVKKARAEYDGYLLIEGEYTNESFRSVFENMRDMNNEIDSLTSSVNSLSSRLKSVETRLAAAELDITTHTH